LFQSLRALCFWSVAVLAAENRLSTDVNKDTPTTLISVDTHSYQAGEDIDSQVTGSGATEEVHVEDGSNIDAKVICLTTEPDRWTGGHGNDTGHDGGHGAHSCDEHEDESALHDLMLDVVALQLRVLDFWLEKGVCVCCLEMVNNRFSCSFFHAFCILPGE